ncbi:hypothetical protein G6O69_34185 [Pseudenhygromyxa sp. WMMC2535]|uniref:multiheme c-type cytochrome n=1 Tax=Pseudenhygromyxa sp. WMMC2535 TaxID=2712867 RepID=UPI0015530BFE|nr:multiheme c-type cytochrome [Pseudenhygromyxa sp. WMMC2535]NVB42921.1 hypothetical protein [Pseudenhygromyxa sp. WMMC2535]
MQRLVAILSLSLASLLGLACDPLEPTPAELDAATEDRAQAFEQRDTDPDALPTTPELATPERVDVDIDPGDNQACVDCHPAAAQTWTGSLHQRAWIEPAFQTSYAREPLAFCRTCHVPRADPEHEPPAQLAALGVDCVSCHVRDDVVHTGLGEDGGSPKALAGHRVVRSADFGETACASCHQFEFPRKAHRAPGTLMQKTMLEHERSEWSELDCADCHFPKREDTGGRDHGMSVSRDPELLRASLHAAVTRVDADTLRFELEPVGVGHRFPTGDLFRRLALSVEARDHAGRVIEVERRYLARHFDAEVDGHGYIGEAPDDRLSGPASVSLSLARADQAAELRWQVSYQRVDSRDHAHPERSQLAGEVVLARGVITP